MSWESLETRASLPRPSLSLQIIGRIGTLSKPLQDLGIPFWFWHDQRQIVLDDHQQLIASLDAHRLPSFSRNDNLILTAELLNSHGPPVLCNLHCHSHLKRRNIAAPMSCSCNTNAHFFGQTPVAVQYAICPLICAIY